MWVPRNLNESVRVMGWPDIVSGDLGVIYGYFNGFEGAEEDEEVDEKLLEDLEDKQLRERIASLETDHSSTKEQVST